MFELFKEMNWNLIVTLIIVSAAVAWFGDVVGMKLGKKRITLFDLRPKYTSRIISALTGTGIALATLSVISMASEPVRTALFSMNFVQNQITNLTAELQQNRDTLQSMEIDLFKSKGDLKEKQEELREKERELNEKQQTLLNVEKQLSSAASNLKKTREQFEAMKIVKEQTEDEYAKLLAEKETLAAERSRMEVAVSALKDESASLKKGLQNMKEGQIAALSGEVLGQVILLESNLTEYQIYKAIEKLLNDARAVLAYRFGNKPENVPMPLVDKKDIEDAKKTLLSLEGRYLLRLCALENAVNGEPVRCKLTANKTRKIFNEGELLKKLTIPAGTRREIVEEVLIKALKQINIDAAAMGILRDPLTGNVGQMDTNDFISAVKNLTATKQSQSLSIIVAADTYTEGPVNVKFFIEQEVI